jgi:DNA-binding NtrC family response regulator
MNFFEADKKPAATMNSSVRSLALVVEDDQFEREVLGDLLKDENIEFIQCESAELVIAKVGAELKLLVTDVRLAGPGSGIELAEFAQQQFPHLHIVVV